MDRRYAFEQSWALRHRVSVEEIREHRFQTENGYDLPLLATNYRTWCAAIDSMCIALPISDNAHNTRIINSVGRFITNQGFKLR